MRGGQRHAGSSRRQCTCPLTSFLSSIAAVKGAGRKGTDTATATDASSSPNGSAEGSSEGTRRRRRPAQVVLRRRQQQQQAIKGRRFEGFVGHIAPPRLRIAAGQDGSAGESVTLMAQLLAAAAVEVQGTN